MAVNWTALVVFVALFLFVTVLGFVAARWRQGDLDLLHEWGLGGRRFGTFVTWFLLGGDLYTAYTFVAVPALMFGAGALGFFAVPYTIMIYPLLYLFFPRIWRIARERNCVTAADIVQSEFANRWLALAVAATGLVATMPYIALQLVGMEVVIGAMGIETSGFIGDLPLIIAFVILAAFTYTSGLRAPAMIAVVKDVLIYITVIAAIIVVPMHLGGFSNIFAAVPAAKQTLPVPPEGSLGSYSAYATLAFGSALALFLYPHSLTGILSSSSERVIRRNAAILPAYSVVLGLLALLGFMAIALGVKDNPAYADGFARYGNNFSVPALFLETFPSWFVGVAFAAIAIGALVPAAIMSIAAANTWTRNIYREFIKPTATDAEESRMAKLVSLIVKAGALVFIFALPLEYAIQLQLLGGIWMSQILPSLVLGLRWRVLNGWGLLIGWVCGMVLGSWMAYLQAFKNATYALNLFGLTIPGYAAVYALVVNIVVSVIVSLVFSAAGSSRPQTPVRIA
ncbi:monocarboxylate uptake permease MctP [Aureimonas leprariae]|uniref:Sodium:solute symporter n=1 Tax=Plantimonas leprariae TaxID=2615207 RepID=A0A7V7TXY7_9HYPH|nr:sodium:solute symporter [Aureimonas leprariae]KAB0676394.1 sodium:solute symporter [Aureimonas leprariae]